jgi:hypothetical protein
MKPPTLWTLDPDQYQFRVEFRFTDVRGNLLRSKTWELAHRHADPLKTYLLQAQAALVKRRPEIEHRGRNYYVITIIVEHLRSDLHTSVFNAGEPEAVLRQMALMPLTVGIVADAGGLHFSLHATNNKP